MKHIIFLSIATIVYSAGLCSICCKDGSQKANRRCLRQQKCLCYFPGFKGQEEAKCPMSKEDIIKRLNSETTFLKDSATYQDKGMVNIIINCKGQVVQCEIDNKTRHAELDKQIVAVFNTLGTWKPGKMNGDKVDTSRLWSFEIKNGEIPE